MTQSLQEILAPYLTMMNSLPAGSISAADFQRKYLQEVKSESRNIPNDLFGILNWLFVETDFYVGDPELRDAEEDLDDEQLRQKVREALAKLDAIR